MTSMQMSQSKSFGSGPFSNRSLGCTMARLEEMRREEMIRLLNILLLFALDTNRDLTRKDPVYIEASYLASHNQ